MALLDRYNYPHFSDKNIKLSKMMSLQLGKNKIKTQIFILTPMLPRQCYFSMYIKDIWSLCFTWICLCFFNLNLNSTYYRKQSYFVTDLINSWVHLLIS